MKLKTPTKNEGQKKFGRIVFEAVKKMKELGFQDDKGIRDALIQAGYNIEIAVSILLCGN